MSDKQKIRQYLKTHTYIDCESAYLCIGVRNMRSRASEMRDLESYKVPVIREDGKPTIIARYKLIKKG